MADIDVVFYSEPPQNLVQKYAVIVARFHDQLLWCRHHDRCTWEIPGGHIEPGETALQAAARELEEETGAIEYTLSPLCWYSAYRSDNQPRSCGLLCIADVQRLSGSLQNEIEEVQCFSIMPAELTYPAIQPKLLEAAVCLKMSYNGAS